MRSEIAQPCCGPDCKVRRIRRSSVPWRRSSRDGWLMLSDAYNKRIAQLLSDVNNRIGVAVSFQLSAIDPRGRPLIPAEERRRATAALWKQTLGGVARRRLRFERFCPEGD